MNDSNTLARFDVLMMGCHFQTAVRVDTIVTDKVVELTPADFHVLGIDEDFGGSWKHGIEDFGTPACFIRVTVLGGEGNSPLNVPRQRM